MSPSPHELVQEVRRLTRDLYTVLQAQVGASNTELVEHVIVLARARRGGDQRANKELDLLIESLDNDQTGVVLRAIGILFDLINMVEDRHRIRVLRDRETRSGDEPRLESIGAAVNSLSKKGLSAAEVQDFLDKLDIEPVFTAHPTEAKRRTLRSSMRDLQRSLEELSKVDLLPREEIEINEQIIGELTSIWQTDSHRPERPTVTEEVSRSRFVLSTLWNVVPRLYTELEDALEKFYPTLKNVRLTNYKVRVLDTKAGTGAKVRVLLEASDGTDWWGTVGVSENIIQASWEALTESLAYKLYKDRSLRSSSQN